MTSWFRIPPAGSHRMPAHWQLNIEFLRRNTRPTPRMYAKEIEKLRQAAHKKRDQAAALEREAQEMFAAAFEIEKEMAASLPSRARPVARR